MMADVANHEAFKYQLRTQHELTQGQLGPHIENNTHNTLHFATFPNFRHTSSNFFLCPYSYSQQASERREQFLLNFTPSVGFGKVSSEFRRRGLHTLWTILCQNCGMVGRYQLQKTHVRINEGIADIYIYICTYGLYYLLRHPEDSHLKRIHGMGTLFEVHFSLRSLTAPSQTPCNPVKKT